MRNILGFSAALAAAQMAGIGLRVADPVDADSYRETPNPTESDRYHLERAAAKRARKAAKLATRRTGDKP